MACDKCENPQAFPPFLGLEWVLAIDMGELGITTGADMDGVDDDVTR